MNRDAITELFDYTGWAWERIARVIEDQLLTRYASPVEANGWPSIAACLTHTVGAYDGWLNMEFGGIEAGEASFPGEWPKPIDDWLAMTAYHDRVRESFRRAINVPDEALYERRLYNTGESPEQLSRADILANLVMHERGHHGDLNTLFHQHGVKSYLIDFRFFRSFPEKFLMDDDEE